MSSHTPWLAILLGLTSGVWGSVAAAEPPPPAVQFSVQDHTQAEAREQHRAGVEAYAAGNYAEAISAFLTADALRSSAATTFNLAKTYEAMDDSSHALQYYREYLRRSPSAADRAVVAKRVAKLSQQLAGRGVQQVSFIVTPAGSGVFLDAEPIGVAPITLDISPGTHSVEFRKQGYAPARFGFELSADRPVDVVAKLSRDAFVEPARASASVPGSRRAQAKSLPSSDDARAAARVAPAAARGSAARTVGFVALGASVAALGGAITLEAMRSNAEAEARRASDQVGYSEALERMKSRQTMARVFAGAGGVLAALGGVVLVAASGATERPKENAGFAVACLPAKCHATLSGAF